MYFRTVSDFYTRSSLFFCFHISTDILSDGKLKAVGELITLENKLVCFLKQMPDVVVAVCFVVLFLLLIFSRTRI